MISLPDFQVDRQIFEARFPQNFLFWDRAGHLWTAASRKLPGVKLVNVDPNHTQFEAGNFQYIAESGIIRVIAKDNEPFSEFEKLATIFFEIVVEFLDIEMFDRVALRTVWTKQYESTLKAVESFRELNLLSEPNGETFGIKTPPIGLDVKVTWEDERTGATLGCRTEKRKVEPIIPWDFRSQIKAASSVHYYLVLDVDYYTIAKVQRDQIDAREWISSSNRFVKKVVGKEMFK